MAREKTSRKAQPEQAHKPFRHAVDYDDQVKKYAQRQMQRHWLDNALGNLDHSAKLLSLSVYLPILAMGGYPDVDEHAARCSARKMWLQACTCMGDYECALKVFHWLPDREQRERANNFLRGLNADGEADPQVWQARAEYARTARALMEIREHGRVLQTRRKSKTNNRAGEPTTQFLDQRYLELAEMSSKPESEEPAWLRAFRSLQVKPAQKAPLLSIHAQRKIAELEKQLYLLESKAKYNCPYPSLEDWVGYCIQAVKRGDNSFPRDEAKFHENQKWVARRFIPGLMPETRGGKRHYDLCLLKFIRERCIPIAKRLRAEWRAIRRSHKKPAEEIVRRYPLLLDIYPDPSTVETELQYQELQHIARVLTSWVWKQIPQRPFEVPTSIQPETVKKSLRSFARRRQ